MNRRTAVVLLTIFTAMPVGAASQQPAAGDQRALRARIEARFDIVSVTGGIALRPKSPMGNVRLIDFSDGTILVNGEPVSGRELRERLGADAEGILQLSYLTPEARRALAGSPAAEREPPIEPGPPVEPGPPIEAVPPLEPPAPPAPDRSMQRHRHSSGDRVRIFGDVSVAADERISGQAVAVLGSVRVDGEVGDQVVAVLGSIDLGPNAVVRGDVVSVGGRVRRAEGAQIRGGVTEISFADPNIRVNFHPFIDWGGLHRFNGFGAIPRLLGTAIRFLLLVLLTSIALVVARPMVEASAQRVSDNPVQATLVGIAAQILLLPALILTTVVLAISIIGIPLLFLLPFALLVLLLLALVGFSGTVFAVGQWMRRRLGLAPTSFGDIVLGVMVILLPVLLARLMALGGWPVTPLVVLLLVIGFTVEFLAWSSGFGAVLTNGFSRWQARRASRVVVTPPPA